MTGEPRQSDPGDPGEEGGAERQEDQEDLPHSDDGLDLARRMAERPALSLSLAKQVLDAGLDSTVDGAMAREVEHALLTSLSGENDAPREGFNRG